MSQDKLQTTFRSALMRGAFVLLGRRRAHFMHCDARYRLEPTLWSCRSTIATSLGIGRVGSQPTGIAVPQTMAARYAQSALERHMVVAVSRVRHIDCSPEARSGDAKHSAVTWS